MDILNLLISYAAQIINYLFPHPFGGGITTGAFGDA